MLFTTAPRPTNSRLGYKGLNNSFLNVETITVQLCFFLNSNAYGIHAIESPNDLLSNAI